MRLHGLGAWVDGSDFIQGSLDTLQFDFQPRLQTPTPGPKITKMKDGPDALGAQDRIPGRSEPVAVVAVTVQDADKGYDHLHG
jgi:hypothetical protein